MSGLELRVPPDGDEDVEPALPRARTAAPAEARRLPSSELAKARTQASAELRKVDAASTPRPSAGGEAGGRAGETRQHRGAVLRPTSSGTRSRRNAPGAMTRQDRVRDPAALEGPPVTSITRRDCRELVQAIADRGAPIYANRIAALTLASVPLRRRRGDHRGEPGRTLAEAGRRDWQPTRG